MRTTSRRLRIGISGSYGGMNLGDEAILDGILSQLRATVPPTSPSSPGIHRTPLPGTTSSAPSRFGH